MTNDCELSYEELLDLTNDISSHLRCLNFLMTGVYKFLSAIMNNVHSLEKEKLIGYLIKENQSKN